jgi:translation elongation factor P/translation initiation factor 5A
MDLETYESTEATIDPEIKEALQPNWTVIYWDIMGIKIIKSVKSRE